MKKTLVMLVHGTWGGRKKVGIITRWVNKNKKPLWFEPGGQFHDKISEISHCKVMSFDWGGPNSLKYRDIASKKLSRILFKELKNENYEKVILIGHSHGGNVAIKSLDYLKSLGCHISSSNTCIITMGTPFIYFKSQSYRSGIALFWYSMIFTMSIMKINHDIRKYSRVWKWDTHAIFILFFCLMPIFYKTVNRLRGNKSGVYDPRKVEFKACLHEKIPAYIFRTSHDEASFGTELPSLFFTIFNNSSNLFFYLLQKYIRPFLGTKKENSHKPIIRIINLVVTQLFTFTLGSFVTFLLFDTILFQILISFILLFWSLYIVSFSFLGLPLNGLKDLDIYVDSVPDGDFNYSIKTFLSESIILSSKIRHSLYEDKECIAAALNVVKSNAECKAEEIDLFVDNII